MSEGAKKVSEGLTDASARPLLKNRGALLLLFAISLAMIVSGLVTPALHVSSFWLLSDDVSILDSIQAFWDDGQVFLAGLIFVVSVIFPLFKVSLASLLTLFYAPRNEMHHRLAALLAELARWSMADVFILAVAVMVIDARLISAADLRPGAYLFAGGVLLSSLSVTYLRARQRRDSK